MSLHGKTVLVTGAARGLGASTIRAYARHGARVILADVRTETQGLFANHLKNNGIEAHEYAVDVASDHSVNAFAAMVLRDVGVPDIIHLNAAIIITGNLLKLPMSDIQKHFDVNVYGYLRVIRAFTPHMVERGSGQIAITSSPTGLTPPPVVATNLSAYTLTKSAQMSMARSLAVTMKDDGISVSLLLPPLVDTPGIQEADGHASDEFNRRLGQMAQASPANVDEAAEKLVRGVIQKKFLVCDQPNYNQALKMWLENEMQPFRDYMKEAEEGGRKEG